MYIRISSRDAAAAYSAIFSREIAWLTSRGVRSADLNIRTAAFFFYITDSYFCNSCLISSGLLREVTPPASSEVYPTYSSFPFVSSYARVVFGASQYDYARFSDCAVLPSPSSLVSGCLACSLSACVTAESKPTNSKHQPNTRNLHKIAAESTQIVFKYGDSRPESSSWLPTATLGLQACCCNQMWQTCPISRNSFVA